MTTKLTAEPENSARGTTRTPPRTPRRMPQAWVLGSLLIALSVFFSLASPYFLTVSNLLNVVDSIAVTGIIAAPVTMLMIAGRFDLSVGSSLAFATATFAVVARDSGQTVWALCAAAGVALLVGLLNAFFVTVVRVNSLVTTLGIMAIFGGLAQVAADGQSVPAAAFSELAATRLPGDIPVSVVILVGVMGLCHVLLSSTVLGRDLYAVGANEAAARLNGIRIGRVTLVAYLLVGVGVLVGTVLFLSQVRGYEPGGGNGLELAVLTAVVLGGTSLQGGRGTILGTLFGLLIVGVMSNGLVLTNVGSFWQGVAQGSLLILAVAFDQSRRLTRRPSSR